MDRLDGLSLELNPQRSILHIAQQLVHNSISWGGAHAVNSLMTIIHIKIIYTVVSPHGNYSRYDPLGVWTAIV